ncbi:hypothetical protein I3F58_22945 [Streptomyces sp. MUM 203J]|uniref:hypothetical protein n=1 Tax=Streptomyces sp. MUM 203J TaxID=2791990 RepID=UPI001F047A67|nr:hypothetical protein [Streptomyces sp. MUM 203J]MCH0542356.1 hypothetical protein [Streptomyces sp. MUM 203J]
MEDFIQPRRDRCFATLISPVAAFAADGPEPAPEGICSGGWRKNVYGYKATHLGKGSVYKDGPGGTVVVTKIKSETLSTEVGGVAGVSADFVVLEAKAEVSASATKAVTWDTSHQYRRNISRGKYGNVQYGSWGHTATVEKYYQLPDCRKSQRSTGWVKVANEKVGFRYWETSN